MPRIGSISVNGFLRPWQEWSTTLAGWDAEQNAVTRFVLSITHIICVFNDPSAWSISSRCAAARSCPSVCAPTGCSTPGLPVHHHLPECAQMHVHRVSDAIQPSHPLSSPSPPASVFPSIRVFSNELTLRIRWPQSWSFSFSIVYWESLQSLPIIVDLSI